MPGGAEKDLKLDDEANRLYAELGGLELGAGPPKDGPAGYELSQTLNEEEQLLDQWRTLLADFVHLLVNNLSFNRLSMPAGGPESEWGALTSVLDQLAQVPGHDGKIMIRHRGMGFSSDGAQGHNDYVITFGSLALDQQLLKAIIKRRGLGVAHLSGRVARAFDMLASMEIFTLRVAIGHWTAEESGRVEKSLRILASYYNPVGGNGTAGQAGNGFPVIMDEYGRSDPNLTLVAGLKGIKAESLQALIRKVYTLMRKPDAPPALEKCANVYGAMFLFSNLKGQLIKPPVEINNVRWFVMDRDQELMDKDKARLARKVMAEYGGSPAKAAGIMNSIYDRDTDGVKAGQLGGQLVQISDFLDEIEKTDDDESASLETEVISSIEQRLDGIQDEVYEEIDAAEQEVRTAATPAGAAPRRLHEGLSDLLSFFKQRVGTRKKIRSMLRSPVEFEKKDFETVGRDFSISPEDARQLLTLLQRCFNKDGRFLRQAFERSIPHFARHEKKVFEFLWHYLREIINRDDRVAYLNSLQLLIARMQQPMIALEVLLESLYRASEAVNFSDRNAMILSNILLRKYNQEIKNDVEITPEEVLKVKSGLNEEVVEDTRRLLERERGDLFEKIKSIHQTLKDTLRNGRPEPGGLPGHYLISLEREIYIFLSLVGGETAGKVVRSSLKEYGDPNAEIYRLVQGPDDLKGILNLLQVTIRGLARFGQESDLPTFAMIRDKEAGFMSRSNDSRYEEQVRRVMAWTETAAGGI